MGRVPGDVRVWVNHSWPLSPPRLPSTGSLPEVILLAVRWYVRYGLSYRDVEELLAERGIDVYASKRRNIAAATTFFTTALNNHGRPAQITTDLAALLLRVIDELIPEALHDTEQYSNNCIENDHGRLKARLKPMPGLRADQTASVVIRGHAFTQNLRRGHYELGAEINTSVYACRQLSMNSPKRSDRNPDTKPINRAGRSINAKVPFRAPSRYQHTSRSISSRRGQLVAARSVASMSATVSNSVAQRISRSPRSAYGLVGVSVPVNQTPSA